MHSRTQQFQRDTSTITACLTQSTTTNYFKVKLTHPHCDSKITYFGKRLELKERKYPYNFCFHPEIWVPTKPRFPN